MEQMADESWELAHKVHRTVDTSRTTVPTRRSIFIIFVKNIRVICVIRVQKQIIIPIFFGGFIETMYLCTLEIKVIKRN